MTSTLAPSRRAKVLALTVSQFSATVMSIIVASILARRLTYEGYATYRQTFLPFYVLFPLLSLGVPQALYYFLPNQEARWREHILAALFWLIVSSSAFCLSYFIFGRDLIASLLKNPALGKLLKWLLIFTPASLVLGLLPALLIAINKISTLSYFTIISRCFIGLAVIASAISFKGPEVPIIANAVSTSLAALVALVIIVDVLRHSPTGRFKASSARDIISYAGPLGIASIVDSSTMETTKMVAATFCSETSFAIFVNGSIEIPLIGNVTGSISNVIISELRGFYLKADTSKALQLFRAAALKAAYILFPATVFLFITAETIMVVLFSSNYLASAVPFRMLLLLLPLRIVFYGPLFIAIGRPRAIMVRSLIGYIILLVLALPLVKLIGYIGATVAYLVSVGLFQYGYNIIYLERRLNIGLSDILPIRELGRTASGQLIPGLFLVAVMILTARWAPLARLSLATFVFWGWIGYWWYGKIYFRSDLTRISNWLKKGLGLVGNS